MSHDHSGEFQKSVIVPKSVLCIISSSIRVYKNSYNVHLHTSTPHFYKGDLYMYRPSQVNRQSLLSSLPETLVAVLTSEEF